MKNPNVACVIMVIAIVLSVLIGGHRSLSAEASKVEDIFYNGVDGDGIGVNSDLDHRAALAYALVTVAKRYLPADDADIEAVLDACSALENAKIQRRSSKQTAGSNRLVRRCIKGLIKSI